MNVTKLWVRVLIGSCSCLGVACSSGGVQDSTSPAEQGGSTGMGGHMNLPPSAAGASGAPRAGSSGMRGVAGSAGLAAGSGGASGSAGMTPPRLSAGASGAGGAGGASGRGGAGGAAVTSGVGGDAGGAAGTAGRSGSGAPTFTEVYQLLVYGCNGCHARGQGGLSMMTQESAYMNLVDVSSQACSSVKRVKPGDPSQSLVYLAITRVGMSGNCKVPSMPPGNIKWEQDSIDQVKAWIGAGAKND